MGKKKIPELSIYFVFVVAVTGIVCLIVDMLVLYVGRETHHLFGHLWPQKGRGHTKGVLIPKAGDSEKEQKKVV